MDGLLLFWSVAGYVACAWIVAALPWPMYAVSEESRRHMTPEEIERAERIANRLKMAALVAFAPLVMCVVLVVGVFAVGLVWAETLRDSVNRT